MEKGIAGVLIDDLGNAPCKVVINFDLQAQIGRDHNHFGFVYNFLLVIGGLDAMKPAN